MADAQNSQSKNDLQAQIRAEPSETQDLQSDETKISRPAKSAQSSRRPLFRT